MVHEVVIHALLYHSWSVVTVIAISSLSFFSLANAFITALLHSGTQCIPLHCAPVVINGRFRVSAWAIFESSWGIQVRTCNKARKQSIHSVTWLTDSPCPHRLRWSHYMVLIRIQMLGCRWKLHGWWSYFHSSKHIVNMPVGLYILHPITSKE